MADNRPEYLAYLLRLWRGTARGEVFWRASLQNPQTRERVGFASLDELFVFLRERTGVVSDVNGDGCGTEK